MKAYKVWDVKSDENCSAIVFAENAKEAKKIAQSTDACEYAEFIDIRVNRVKEADQLYKGQAEADWYDEKTRIFLVKELGWACYETSFECEKCAARKYCNHWGDNDAID